MRGTIIAETQEEYDKWLASQAPYFAPAAPAAADTTKPAEAPVAAK